MTSSSLAVTNEEVKLEVRATCAFICRGSCAALLDRMFTCADPTCTYFGRPMEQTSVEFVCGGCGSAFDSGPRQCCHASCPAFIRTGVDAEGKSQRKPVLILSQFPASVVATDCGLHIPQLKKHDIPELVVQPKEDTAWANRHVVFFNVALEGSDKRIANNHVIVMPGQPLKLSLAYCCSWRQSPTDYCPTCIVQWYVGIKARFGNQLTVNLVRSFHNGKRGAISQSFEAPMFPGIYYITSQISLDYDFVPVSFENSPNNAIAVVQVAYCDYWNVANHRLLPKAERAAIEAFFLLGGPSNHPRHRTRNPMACPCRLGGLGGPHLSRIFSFLGSYRD